VQKESSQRRGVGDVELPVIYATTRATSGKNTQGNVGMTSERSPRSSDSANNGLPSMLSVLGQDPCGLADIHRIGI
jgi:hypothetical protein